MRSFILVSALLWALFVAPTFGSIPAGGAAKCLMELYGERLLAGEFSVRELFGDLYVKQYVDVEKHNLLLNLIPDLARFDKEKGKYLSELFYEVHYLKDALPDVRRVAHLTSFGRGNGEVERIMYYISPDLLKEKIFKAQYLSPLYPTNFRYYDYSPDTTYTGEGVKILFTQKFDNIKLIDAGWVVFGDDSSVRSARFEGWDEQSTFEVECAMGDEGLSRNVVKEMTVAIDYNFAGNRLKISAAAEYDYSVLSNELNEFDKKSRYDVTGSLNTNWSKSEVGQRDVYAALHRTLPLTGGDSLLYNRKSVQRGDSTLALIDEKKSRSKVIASRLWDVGDEMISSHTYSWGDNDVKMYPIINPSYMRYSSSKGFTYKLALNLQSRIGDRHALQVKPTLGYSFKLKEFYWNVSGRYLFDKRRNGVVTLSAGRENSIYRKVEIEKIKDVEFSQVHFSEMALKYYRDTRVRFNVKQELFNGFEASVGVNFYYRSMNGSAVGEVVDGKVLQRKYKNFAPVVQLVWQPGMYHYYDGEDKVNLGSRMPRFSLNVEQGVRGVLDSKSLYTRAELDVQHKMRLTSSLALYARVGAGGYLYDKDATFISYAFLKDNILPLDKDDELKGVFQLLDSEWYNSANRYFRVNATCVSPFIILQQVLPQVKFFKNEMLFFNMLFLSKLHPYSEYGYGVETPYLNVGFFAGFENFSFHKIGCKITISLFED